ncbi:MAG: hypothetical protein IAE97_03620 [Chthoniobacterales bacterium]|nr:hypothetical protein [Chthoniobacterales bacterium]
MGSVAFGQAFTLPQNQLTVVVAPGFNHAPVDIPVNVVGGFQLGSLQVGSDAAEVLPSVVPETGRIRLEFSTKDMIAGKTVTLTASGGGTSSQIFVTLSMVPLNVYRLLEDPARATVYGIHLNGAELGAVFNYDPRSATYGSCLTVGKRPTDFAISRDASELFVICSADKAIYVIDLNAFAVKEVIPLAVYGAWGSATDTIGRVLQGPSDVLYYIDGAWGPTLHVLNRTTRQVIQSLQYLGGAPTNTLGFQGIAFTSDFTRAAAMPQYGWSAGVHNATLASYSVASDGKLSFVRQTAAITGLQREPFAAPALIAHNDGAAFFKTLSVSPDDINDVRATFSGPVWSITRNGELVATATGIYHVATGNLLASIPGATSAVSGYLGTKAQAFTSDYQRFVYFNPSDRKLYSLDISSQVAGIIGSSVSPVDKSVVLPPGLLGWSPFVGISQYRVYLGGSQDAVSNAGVDSPEFLGTFNGNSAPVPGNLDVGQTYYWRVDGVVPGGISKGLVFSFTTSAVAPGHGAVSVSLVHSEVSRTVEIPLASESSQAWQASCDAGWIELSASSGTAPGTLAITLDPEGLEVGLHRAEVIIDCSSGPFAVPVELHVNPLHLTHLKSDRNSAIVYGISENTAVAGSKAFLLEIDAASERILRSIQVGSSVTDIEIHRPEGRIYVTNHRDGHLLAVNRSTFVIERTYAFAPMGQIGYATGDVFRVAAGTHGRLVVEEMDQWVQIDIFNTSVGNKLATASVREGGGAFDSTGRFYYHGENNSSGAKLIHFDVTGDQFTQLGTSRPDGISYYGSRTVLVSENDNRIFWAHAVFDSAINPEWVVGETIYSCNGDGRLAFAENKIYDINRRLSILGMPSTTRVSAYNTATAKLVAPVAGKVGFFALQLPVQSLVAPQFFEALTEGIELTSNQGAQVGSAVVLRWRDLSLETGFHIQMRTQGQQAWQDVSASVAQNATSYVVKGLQPLSTYEFRMRATAPEVSSPWEGPLVVELPSPPPPVPNLHLPTRVEPFEVGLRWTVSGIFGGTRIERRLSGHSDPWEVIAEVSPGQTTYEDLTVQPQTTYIYRVSTFTGDLTSSPSTERTVTTPQLSAPTIPTNLVGQAAGAFSIALSWSDAGNETEYRVERRIGEGQWNPIATLPADSTNHTDMGLVHGTYYNYRVVAVNSAGETASSSMLVLAALTGPILEDDFDPWVDAGVWSIYTNAFVGGGSPGFRDGNALWFGGGGQRRAETVRVNVSDGGWLRFTLRGGNEDISGAGYWDKAEEGEHIIVEFSTTPGVWQILAMIDIADVEHHGWMDFDILLPVFARSESTSFRWRQAAHSGVNYDTWAVDDVQVIGVLPPPPGAPPFIMASANSSTAVAVWWGVSQGALNYQIQRRTPSTDWETIGTSGGASFFTDATARPATAYAYRVLSGNNGGWSDPSQQAFVTTWSILQEWRFQNYGTIHDAGVAADLADNGTGVSNLLRYAFNMTKDDRHKVVDPEAGTKGLPFVHLHGDRLQIAFIRKRDAESSGLEYIPEFSGNMVAWDRVGIEVFAENIDEEFEFVIVRDNHAPGTTSASRFARVRVVRK